MREGGCSVPRAAGHCNMTCRSVNPDGEISNERAMESRGIYLAREDSTSESKEKGRVFESESESRGGGVSQRQRAPGAG